jgi:hypothetical protein
MFSYYGVMNDYRREIETEFSAATDFYRYSKIMMICFINKSKVFSKITKHPFLSRATEGLAL